MPDMPPQVQAAPAAQVVSATDTASTSIAAPRAARGPSLFFDDFAPGRPLAHTGWVRRRSVGHPGPQGAVWSADAARVVASAEDDDRRGAVLRLSAHTDGTAAGTSQAQVCQTRRFFHGTYAARVRFTDQPVSGADGDPVIQTFYAVSPLRFPYDPTFSEVDFEYLPNGGWGSSSTRLYAITWQTVRVEPWDAYNAAREVNGSHEGWRVLTLQVEPTRVRHYVDGRLVADHSGRSVPVQPMSLAFNLWFSPTGLMPPSPQPRVWEQDVDWVLHVPGPVRSPAEMLDTVQALRAEGRAHLDTLPTRAEDGPADCDF